MKNVFLLLIGLCFSHTAMANERIHIVASIKPLQLIVQDLVGDLGDVDVLIPLGSSPHHYSLKPSDLRKLHKADLAIWVGPDMEQFLTKTLAGTDTATVQLMATSVHSSEAQSEHAGHDHDHHHHGEDPHIWMDPVKMVAAGAEIKRALSQHHPHLAAQLDKNYQQFATKLLTTDKAIRTQLAPVKEQGFVAFHDAFGLFVEHYGLNQRAYFTVDPARAPGAKKLQEIRTLLKEDKVVCIFTEPQFQAKVVKRIVVNNPVKMGKLDPLAIDITSAQGYTGFLQRLADNMENCLS